MAAPTTSAEFVSLLEQSQLISSEQLAQTRDLAKAEDLKTLARHIASRGYVTLWQAKQLLAGGTSFYLGRYKLLDRLGEGGRGKIYLAEQAPVGRRVALKVLAKELLTDPEAVARWQREIRIAAALSHPNIVTAYDAETVGDVHFMVMEYVNGRDLKRWSDDLGQLPIDWSCTCIWQAAKGLAHAHSRGIVHRDVKASNLLVIAETTAGYPLVKILDLGFARFISGEEESLRITHPGQTFGTPDYMAPEQAESAHTADGRADVFSLGCTLFKLLTAEFPYLGVNAMQKLLARANNEARPLLESRADAPQELAAVVAKMLGRKPEARYQSAEEVAEALEPFIKQPPPAA
jgi:serine/threonine protein kinase